MAAISVLISSLSASFKATLQDEPQNRVQSNEFFRNYANFSDFNLWFCCIFFVLVSWVFLIARWALWLQWLMHVQSRDFGRRENGGCGLRCRAGFSLRCTLSQQACRVSRLRVRQFLKWQWHNRCLLLCTLLEPSLRRWEYSLLHIVREFWSKRLTVGALHRYYMQLCCP